MALEPSLVPVLFDKGLEQKTNYKLAVPGSFLTLENAVRRKASLWEKRYGTTSLTKNYSFPYYASPFNPAITSGTRLGSYNDNLVMFDGRNLWPYAPTSSAFTLSMGTAAAVDWDNHQLIRSQWDTTAADLAYCNGLVAAAFYNGTYGPGFAIYDATTGACVFAPQTLPGVTTYEQAVKVVAVGDYFLFLFWTGAGGNALSLYSVRVAAGTPPLQGSLNTTLGLSTQFSAFDIEAFDATSAIIAVTNSAGTGMTVAKVTAASCTVTSQVTSSASSPTVKGVGCVAGNVYLSYTSGTTLYAVAYNGALTAHSTTSAIDTSAHYASFWNAGFTLRQNAAPIGDNPSNATVSVVYDGLTSAGTPLVSAASFSWNGVNGSTFSPNADMTYPGISLATRPFYGADQSIYFYALVDTPLQPTYFLMRFDTIYLIPVCVAKFAPSSASHLPAPSGTPTQPSISRVTSDGTSFHTALRAITAPDANVIQQVGIAPPPNPAINGVDHYSVRVTGGDYLCKNLGQGLQFVSGGLVNHFDGVTSAEIGFHQFPENITVSGQTTGGSLTLAGTYHYRVIWEWVDNSGQVHRSCPSTIQHVTLTGSNNKFTLSIPPIFVGSKDWWYTNTDHTASYRAVVYLAVNQDASVFYRHDLVLPSSIPQPGKASANLTIDIFDEPVITNEILYTTGGIVENIAPPAARCAHVHKNRMWLGGLENSELWFSKEWNRGEGISFSDIFVLPIETLGGRVTAFATLDDKLIIFKKDRLYFLTGDGPTNDGGNWDYPEPVHIPSDVGTVQPNTVVELPGGVVFKSLKGWYMLTRALQIVYIGARVEDFNSKNARSATVLSDQNEVRFVHSDGDCLVYNYFFNQWSTFTNYLGVASVAANSGEFYRLSSDGTVHQEVAGQYNDDGVKYSLVVETSWLSLAKLQGYQRVYALQLLADFVDDHQLEVQIAYDFQNTYNQTVNFTTTGVISGTVLQLRIQPAIQKCTAVKLRIVDNDTVSPSGGASLKPTSLAVEVGRKKGAVRLPPAQSL